MENLKYLMIIFLISDMGKAIKAQNCGVSPLNTPTVGGKNASAGIWPWQADLYYFGYRLCGGSLISHEWVLTAALCVYYIPESYITVYLGRNSQNASDSTANGVNLRAQSIIIHPDFDPFQFVNDIALLRLAEPVNFTSSISPICLAANDSVFHNGTTCWATGWGYNQGAQPSYGALPVVMVKVVGNKECDCRYQDIQLYWDITITETTMCTSGETGYGACYGQLGDPLQCMQGSVWILAGVTNFGFCGTGVAPDIYSRVSKFQSWILNNVNESDIGFATFKSDGKDKDSSFLCNGEDTVSGLFYPFGNGDTENPSKDHGLSPVVFEKSFVYFGRVYKQTYVNNNGYLTFDGPLSEPIPNVILSELNRDIIAPFWTNMDNTVNGSVSYRQVTKGGLLLAASNDINQYFPHLNFTAYWLFMATWDKVPYFNDSQSSSSFQVILVSGGSLSFVMINYGNISSTNQRFQAGYGTMNLTNYFSVPILTANKLSNSSNVNMSGRWAFRVDGGPEEGLFYPYGDEDIKNPAEDFGSSPLIPLAQPFDYFGLIYNQLYVNNKGYLTFIEPFYQYYPNLFTAYYSTRDIIAPLWTDIDITRKGAVSYRQSGYDTIDSTDFFLIPVSDPTSLSYTSNVNVLGRWAFRTDNTSENNGLFYPTSYKDSKLYCQSNADSRLLYLRSPFLYFGRKYYNIYVNCNGYLTFNESFNEGSPVAFPANSTSDIIAPLWTEFDSSVDTSVSYRIVTQGRILDRVMTEIKQYFPLFGFSVNNNGDLTFDEPLYQWYPDYFPAYSTRDIIAPLWTDIDNSWEGTISYRQVTDGDILNRASKDINRYFPNLNFSASWVFIATWDKVPYYGYRESESTFQVVLVSDKKRSFTLMHYDYITYHQSAESGYDTNASTVFYSIPVSDVTNLPYTSNVNVKGRWVFPVDNSSEVNGICNNTNSQALDDHPSAAVCGIISVNSSTDIVGGQNSSAFHWPWQASLYWYSGQTCGGSLINKEWVLSAAHCFNGHPNGERFYWTVLLGPKTQDMLDPNRVRGVKAVIKHPYYNPVTNDNDIALVRLSFPITFTDSIRPVCLAAEGSVFNSGTESWITTWTNISDGVLLPSPNVLQEVEVPVIGNRQCNCLYGVGSITDNMICAGLLKEGKDSCQGNSGGPMVSNQSSVWVQSGIVSFASGCAQSDFPGVYTRVSRYQEWITFFTCSDPPGFVQFSSTEADPDYSYSCPGLPLLRNASAVLEQQKQSSATSMSHNYLLSYFWFFLAQPFLFY
ncbi:uncharacterized protein si:dkey-32n7.7 [Danio aesculapii]|uniref:uncharacterized protein si:dkey-32n7.7 n=1 Tax=Danio aesculapii TaxID=1142201 RepID=UPI0024BF6B74|nr:uncharacterized protein si:dkey-32n7.7 [Danio aesculapii]